MNAADVLHFLAPWPTLFLAVIAYGFAPGFLLRLIVLLYERDDPRRAELVAEMYVVPRWRRPFWVAEQLETALFDGLAPRVKWALTGRLVLRWSLVSGVKQNRRYPATFEIPTECEKAEVTRGTVVKLAFRQSDGWCERMWVRVEQVKHFRMVGYLVNQPVDFPRLDYGSRIKFQRKHIIDIDWEPFELCA